MRIVALPCPTCKVPEGSPCQTIDGFERGMHGKRKLELRRDRTKNWWRLLGFVVGLLCCHLMKL